MARTEPTENSEKIRYFITGKLRYRFDLQSVLISKCYLTILHIIPYIIDRMGAIVPALGLRDILG